MDEVNSQPYNPQNHITPDQVPDDTITIIIKSGERTYYRGVNLEDTQEKTAELATILMQQVIDTVDAKGLKSGGSLYAPENQK